MWLLVLRIFQIALSLLIVGALFLLGKSFQLVIGGWLGIIIGIGAFLLFLVAVIVKIKEDDDEEIEMGG